jgi:hypothetical protein
MPVNGRFRRYLAVDRRVGEGPLAIPTTAVWLLPDRRKERRATIFHKVPLCGCERDWCDRISLEHYLDEKNDMRIMKPRAAATLKEWRWNSGSWMRRNWRG